jgi:cytochrome d ubiquinol oxidase subunit II
MHLYDIPICFVLAGMALYTVLGGADFGAGLWQLLAGGGGRGERIRDRAHDALAPVWEANHVWILFVLTVSWTAYPEAFASIASTLSVPLFIAGLGIIFRGASYALRAGVENAQRIDRVFALSSILTPFALGAVVGGIASMRVPVGNAQGDLFSSWLNPTSILVGLLAVAFSAYLAAVYLAADSRRQGDVELEGWFRGRALAAAVVAGALAVAGLVVLHSDARKLFDGLVSGDGLAALIVSGLAGGATLVLVLRRRYELARLSASLAVATVVAGWALAQRPVLLPGLTVQQAAAPDATLVAVIVAVVAGVVVLFPSLALLFSLVLRGRFDEADPSVGAVAVRTGGELVRASRPGLLIRSALACFVAGFAFLTVADAGWAHAIGVAAFVGFVVLAFLALVPRDLAA